MDFKIKHALGNSLIQLSVCVLGLRIFVGSKTLNFYEKMSKLGHIKNFELNTSSVEFFMGFQMILKLLKLNE